MVQSNKKHNFDNILPQKYMQCPVKSIVIFTV